MGCLVIRNYDDAVQLGTLYGQLYMEIMDRWVDFRIILEFRTKSTVPCNEIDWGLKSNSNFNWSSIGNERFSRRNFVP